jgi:hypothetical protein
MSRELGDDMIADATSLLYLERINSNFEQIVLTKDDFEKISAIGKNKHRYD